MSKRDKNFVSFWFWFLALFVMAIPCIGLIMTVVWAFIGDNETRKNYFRAVIVWMLLISLLWLVFFTLLGLGPEIIQRFQEWSNPPHPA